MSLEDVSLRVAYRQLDITDFAMSLEDVSLRVAITSSSTSSTLR